MRDLAVLLLQSLPSGLLLYVLATVARVAGPGDTRSIVRRNDARQARTPPHNSHGFPIVFQGLPTLPRFRVLGDRREDSELVRKANVERVAS